MHLFDQFGNINNRIHFIGVAGIGMSGLAMLVAKKGAIVSGSDLVSSGEIVENLKKFGVKFSPKHDIGNINDKIDLVVTSSAISVDNCELQQAYALGIKVIPRAKLLALVMQNQVGVAVTGTHGKTTTTSILGNILTFSQLDPTIVVGGKVINNNNLQIRVGKGDLFIAEADESDASFLYLTPFLAVLTSFDLDHMENFQGDKAKLGQAFIDFLHLLPANGVAVVSADDQNLAEILNKVHRRCISYGFSQDADYRIDGYRLTEGLYHFELWSPENIKESYSIKQSGRHNVLNAVAAIVAAKQLGVSVEDIKNSLLDFAGVGRRFELIGELNIPQIKSPIKFIDDYGHHPQAIKHIVNTVRELWPQKRLVVCFEPHRYSRLAHLFDDFIKELSTADVVVLLPVYHCNETIVANIDSVLLQQRIGEAAILSDQFSLPDILAENLQENDVVVAMGAGNISKFIRDTFMNLSKRFSESCCG
jgi:UDP-N-acetylmuramate--alanine ligase